MRTRSLRTVVLHVSARCDQTCVHCSIWKSNGVAAPALGYGERIRILDEACSLGARDVLFTGGEPLLCDQIEELTRHAHRSGLAVAIATNGLGLGRAAPWIADLVDSVYVSLDGPRETHDRVRGRGMLARLESSLAALSGRDSRPRLIARSVVSSINGDLLGETVETARALGFDAISFLPVDTTSEAFGGAPGGRALLRVNDEQRRKLREAVICLSRAGLLGGFVVEDERAMMTLIRRLSPSRAAQAPACNAPEWSVVIESDGGIRPCFFQARVGNATTGLSSVRGSEEYAERLRALGPGNETCGGCVCPKFAPAGVARMVEKAKSLVRPHAISLGIRVTAEDVA